MSCPSWPRPPPNMFAGLRPRSCGPRIGNTWSGDTMVTGASNIAAAGAGAHSGTSAAHTSAARATRSGSGIQLRQLDGRAAIHDGAHTRGAGTRHRFLVDDAELQPPASGPDRDPLAYVRARLARAAEDVHDVDRLA